MEAGLLSRKLNRVLDEIQKTEEKIAVWQEHLKELHVLRERLENEEIIKSIRSMKLDSRRMLEVLTGIQNGSISFQYSGKEDGNSSDRILPELAGSAQVQESAPESEGGSNEEI